MKALRRLWCWLTRHDWSWRDEDEVMRQMALGNIGVDSDAFYCRRCELRWRDRCRA